MERDTKTLKTPNGYEVVYQSFATAREIQAIEGKLFEGMKVGMEKGEPSINNFSPVSQQKVEHEMIRLLVVSFKKNEKEVTDRNEFVDFALDQMPSEDYDAVVAALNEVTKKKSTKKA